MFEAHFLLCAFSLALSHKDVLRLKLIIMSKILSSRMKKPEPLEKVEIHEKEAVIETEEIISDNQSTIATEENLSPPAENESSPIRNASSPEQPIDEQAPTNEVSEIKIPSEDLQQELNSAPEENISKEIIKEDQKTKNEALEPSQEAPSLRPVSFPMPFILTLTCSSKDQPHPFATIPRTNTPTLQELRFHTGKFLRLFEQLDRQEDELELKQQMEEAARNEELLKIRTTPKRFPEQYYLLMGGYSLPDNPHWRNEFLERLVEVSIAYRNEQKEDVVWKDFTKVGTAFKHHLARKKLEAARKAQIRKIQDNLLIPLQKIKLMGAKLPAKTSITKETFEAFLKAIQSDCQIHPAFIRKGFTPIIKPPSPLGEITVLLLSILGIIWSLGSRADKRSSSSESQFIFVDTRTWKSNKDFLTMKDNVASLTAATKAMKPLARSRAEGKQNRKLKLLQGK